MKLKNIFIGILTVLLLVGYFWVELVNSFYRFSQNTPLWGILTLLTLVVPLLVVLFLLLKYFSKLKLLLNLTRMPQSSSSSALSGDLNSMLDTFDIKDPVLRDLASKLAGDLLNQPGLLDKKISEPKTNSLNT